MFKIAQSTFSECNATEPEISKACKNLVWVVNRHLITTRWPGMVVHVLL